MNNCPKHIRRVTPDIRYRGLFVSRVPVFKIQRRPRRVPRRVASPTVRVRTAVIVEPSFAPDTIPVVAVPVRVPVVRNMGRVQPWGAACHQYRVIPVIMLMVRRVRHVRTVARVRAVRHNQCVHNRVRLGIIWRGERVKRVGMR